MANLRRTGGLGRDTGRAQIRVKQLTPTGTAPGAPRRRYHRVLADLVDAEAATAAVDTIEIAARVRTAGRAVASLPVGLREEPDAWDISGRQDQRR